MVTSPGFLGILSSKMLAKQVLFASSRKRKCYQGRMPADGECRWMSAESTRIKIDGRYYASNRVERGRFLPEMTAVPHAPQELCVLLAAHGEPGGIAVDDQSCDRACSAQSHFAGIPWASAVTSLTRILIDAAHAPSRSYWRSLAPTSVPSASPSPL
jgi:hypothetical protein